tara:strand:+ start:143 stop:484 length:342 start_codon:yes stop_codon:yes gene_type:complete
MKSILSEEIILQLYNTIIERKNYSPKNSYVSRLINKGTNTILKKIGEESTEVIIASKNENIEEQIHEIADLWFHLLVLMVNQGISLENILQELKNRFGKSGLQEKAQRQELNT